MSSPGKFDLCANSTKPVRKQGNNFFELIFPHFSLSFSRKLYYQEDGNAFGNMIV